MLITIGVLIALIVLNQYLAYAAQKLNDRQQRNQLNEYPTYFLNNKICNHANSQTPNRKR